MLLYKQLLLMTFGTTLVYYKNDTRSSQCQVSGQILTKILIRSQLKNHIWNCMKIISVLLSCNMRDRRTDRQVNAEVKQRAVLSEILTLNGLEFTQISLYSCHWVRAKEVGVTRASEDIPWRVQIRPDAFSIHVMIHGWRQTNCVGYENLLGIKTR